MRLKLFFIALIFLFATALGAEEIKLPDKLVAGKFLDRFNSLQTADVPDSPAEKARVALTLSGKDEELYRKNYRELFGANAPEIPRHALPSRLNAASRHTRVTHLERLPNGFLLVMAVAADDDDRSVPPDPIIALLMENPDNPAEGLSLKKMIVLK